MGVGAKASTPIELNRQETQPTQEKQYANENENTFSSSEYKITGIDQEIWAQEDYEFDESANWHETQHGRYIDYDDQETNLPGWARASSRYTYCNSYENYLGIDPLNYLAINGYNPYPCDLYAFELYGQNLGFGTPTTLQLRIHNEIQIWNDTEYPIYYDCKAYIFVSTDSRIDSFFTGLYDYDVPFYNEFMNGSLKGSAQKYVVYAGDNTTADILVNENIYLTANQTNYIMVYYQFGWYSNETGNTYFQGEDQNGIPTVATTLQFGGLQTGSHEFDECITNLQIRTIRPTNYPTITTSVMPITGVTQEVIDLPGLLWEILSMPFAFYSTAFNLTLFPGTPYAINISNLVLTVFGVLVFVFILKKIKP